MFKKKEQQPVRSRGDELRDYVLLAMFATIILLLTFTPIGFINLVVIKATIVQEIGRASCRERV